MFLHTKTDLLILTIIVFIMFMIRTSAQNTLEL